MTSEAPADSPAQARLRIWQADGPARTVVLVLHGGRKHSTQPTSPWQLAYRRMVPIARAVRSPGTEVWLVRNRLRGWNEPNRDALADARWALEAVSSRHPDAAIVLVGHSMGGRAALLVAGGPGVVGVCALAPWLDSTDPVEQLTGRAVLIAHGDQDTWTDPAASRDYAHRAGAVTDAKYVAVPGAGHAMLRRAHEWTGLVRTFVDGVR